MDLVLANEEENGRQTWSSKREFGLAFHWRNSRLHCLRLHLETCHFHGQAQISIWEGVQNKHIGNTHYSFHRSRREQSVLQTMATLLFLLIQNQLDNYLENPPFFKLMEISKETSCTSRWLPQITTTQIKNH
ncbi:hypothetical protein Dsin_011252 [Dipteronia sinensis]|uniref:Uncharacterized protein n=1 Tax=Dipteronia sinensis TaxID=43782 RepID=A0AAE0EDV4_9ROSI|nr:hypothetical protein Dsin_011252 [Dipteronia sinensis]